MLNIESTAKGIIFTGERELVMASAFVYAKRGKRKVRVGRENGVWEAVISQ